MSLEISVCASDEDYEQWRSVRLAVVPHERCDTVAELQALESPDRLMVLAREKGLVVGSGLADVSDTSDAGFVAPRVLPDHRRRGAGTALLLRLVEHLTSLDRPRARATVEDAGSLSFARSFGFVEAGNEVEQTRSVADVPSSRALPAGVEVVTAADRPSLWAESYEGFGREVMSDFALDTPLDVDRDAWVRTWLGDPMFLAVHDGQVIGCAGLFLDADEPRRAENALTAVRRDWRGRGIADHLKVHTLHWAAAHGIEDVYTWTQDGNAAMRALNERLGYATARTSTFVSRTLPLA